MKVVVGLSAVLPFTGWPLLTGPWLLNSIKLTAFTAGDQTKMDRSFPSCTTEHVHQQRQNGSFQDGLQRSNRVWICCCSLMKSWLIMLFLHKICTRPIGRLVSQFYSSLGCFYPSGTTGRVVSSNTVPDDIFKCIFLKENISIQIQISSKFVPRRPINNMPALVLIMAWRRPGDKPLSEPMMISLPTHICVTRPQWVKQFQ